MMISVIFKSENFEQRIEIQANDIQAPGKSPPQAPSVNLDHS